MAVEAAPKPQGEVMRMADTLDQTQWQRRKKTWNRLMKWGFGGVALGIGLLALSAATLGAAPALATGFLWGANIVGGIGGLSAVTGLGARMFDTRSK